MLIRQLAIFIVTVMVAGLVSCATPVAPTGGPPDRTPPEIVETRPVNETVNFDGRVVEFTFSKFVSRSSLLEAIEVEPDLAIGYDVSWSRRTATIRFERDLPENTTVIITIGTELQDTRNNNLGAPYSLAISTGPEIDEGRVTARVRLADDGTAESGYRVFLYREPFDLAARANYIAQTDTAGQVEFSYLAEDRYKALWVDDTNRNRIWDRDREFAQPFYDSTFTLERGDEIDLGTIYIEKPDTTRPRLQGVGLLTERMMRLRFNEEVYWDESARIDLIDSLGNRYTGAWPLYLLPDDHRVLMAQTDDPLPEDDRFHLELTGITDRAGNRARFTADPFTGSAQADTIGLRIIGDNSEPGLFNDESFVVGYNKLIDDDDVVDSLRVVEGEIMIEEWPNVEIDRHRLIILPEENWQSGITWQFLIWNPHRQELRPYEPTIWQRNQLGAIEFLFEEGEEPDRSDELHDEENHHLHLRLFDEEEKVHIDTTFTGRILIEDLPPLTYTAVVFKDLDGSDSWDSGSVEPYRAPEPYFVRRDIPVRAGFTSELNIRFDIPQNREQVSVPGS